MGGEGKRGKGASMQNTTQIFSRVAGGGDQGADPLVLEASGEYPPRREKPERPGQ